MIPKSFEISAPPFMLSDRSTSSSVRHEPAIGGTADDVLVVEQVAVDGSDVVAVECEILGVDSGDDGIAAAREHLEIDADDGSVVGQRSDAADRKCRRGDSWRSRVTLGPGWSRWTGRP